MSEKVKLDISAMTIVKIVLTFLGLYLLYLIRDILALIFISLILVAAMQPVVNYWGKKIGKTWAVLILTLLMFLGIAGFIYLLIPPLIKETAQLIDSLPGTIERFRVLQDQVPSLENALSSFTQNFGNISSSILSFTAGVFGGIVAFFTVIVLTIYLLLDEKVYSSLLVTFIPTGKRDEALDIASKISLKVGDWLRGQILLGIIIGVISFIGLTIIGVPYALTLAVVAGVLEFIPVVGPIIAGLVAALVGLTISPVIALIVIAFYIVVQQLENHIIVPKIMQKAIGLPPAVIIMAILIGSKLLGILGALLAVPISGIIYVVYKDWYRVKGLIKQ